MVILGSVAGLSLLVTLFFLVHGCYGPPLAANVPLRCFLPGVPSNAVPGEITCQLVTDYPLSAAMKRFVHSDRVGELDLSFVDLPELKDPNPDKGARLLFPQVVPEDVRSELQRISDAEFRLEYWHSKQAVRYQTVIDGIAMPASYIQFTVLGPRPTEDHVVANIRGQLYRLVSRGPAVRLLDPRTAFERSGVGRHQRSIDGDEPINRVYLHYLPTRVPYANPCPSGPLRQVTFRPVWEFFGQMHLMGDIFTGPCFRIDAVTGQAFYPTMAEAVEGIESDTSKRDGSEVPPVR